MNTTTVAKPVKAAKAAKHDIADNGGMDFLQSTPRKLVTVYLPMAVFLFVLLFPFYWMAITSVQRSLRRCPSLGT